jgi:hypothetical protein
MRLQHPDEVKYAPRRRSFLGFAAAAAAAEGARDRLARHLKDWRARMIAVGIQPSN